MIRQGVWLAVMSALAPAIRVNGDDTPAGERNDRLTISWKKNVLYVRIDRKRKFLGTIFLRALGLRSSEDILRTFYTVDRIVVRDKKLLWTLEPGIERPTNLLGLKTDFAYWNPELAEQPTPATPTAPLEEITSPPPPENGAS